MTAAPGRLLRPAVAMGDRLRPRLTTSTLLAVAAVVILLYLVLGPLVMLVLSSFQLTENVLPLSAKAVWSLANYSEVFLDGQTWLLLLRTLVFGAGALVVAFGVGVPAAWLIERTDLPLGSGIFVLLVAPSGIPTLITAIGWSLLLNPTNGILNLPLQNALGFSFNVYSLAGMILVEGFSLVPLTFLLVTAAFRGMNGSLEDAASMSGASLPTRLRRVTLPLLTPAILGALVYEFVNVIEAVDVPLVLGLSGHVTVLSTQVYLSVNPAAGLPNYGISSTYGMLLLALAVGPLIAYNGIIGRSGSYATVGGKAYRPRPTLLGRWRWPACLALVAYVVVTFLLPFLVLLWTSIQPYYAGISEAAFGRITFKGYAAATSSPLVAGAILNTLVVGIVTAAVAMAIAALVSWLIVRSRSRAGTLLDILAFTPHAMPGVVIGLAVLLIYLLLPLPIYGSIWILVIALATQSISLGTRLTTSGIAQVQESLEEAGAMSGAGMGQVWRRILIPLLRPSLVNGYLLIFLASIQNLTLALMLYTPDNTVLSTLIWSGWDHGDITGSAVLSVGMTVITVAAAAILRGATRSSLEA
jgi:iron(III) transport system permease protein